ncbi:MAG: DNA polymerase ligase N-terminal domain-containing protein [Desulfobulbaceae bacterium]|nr:DNA polymerase ligase N-terminal domain-containing protein [Desulfobulbaceae bacterium]
MSPENSLKKYRDKRNFSKTGEPAGRKKKSGKKPVFVIQKHAASRLHYDLRLEIDGVLVSWAVPKGPSTDPGEKRLAVRTEDHPLEYAGFEGIIPEDEYGGGTVLLWDSGTYRNLKEEGDKKLSMSEALANGHLTVWLQGKKLQGGFALTRVKYRSENDWLLVKMKDEKADAAHNPLNIRPESVKSGRTIEEIAGRKGNND